MRIHLKESSNAQQEQGGTATRASRDGPDDLPPEMPVNLLISSALGVTDLLNLHGIR